MCFTSFGKNKFLPENFEGENASVLTSKILSSYLDKDGNTPAGNHAATQILLRMKYLNFSGPIDELVGVTTSVSILKVVLLQRNLTQ